MPNFLNSMAESNFQPEFALPKNQTGPFAQVLLEIIEDFNLSPGAFRLYTLLVAYSRGFGACWLSQRTLAEKLGVSERTVRGWTVELEQSGYITVEHRRAFSGQQQTNLYRLRRYVALKDEEPAHRKKPARTGGTALPLPAENSYQSHRKDASADSYESNLHDKDYINTPGDNTLLTEDAEQQVCVNNSEVIEISEKPEQVTPTANKAAPLSPEQLTLSLIEQQLQQAGISANRVKKAAKTLVQNGRTTRYVEDWVHWIARQSHVQNPAAYLLSRIVENTDVPRPRPAQTNRSVYSFAASASQPTITVTEPALHQEEAASTVPSGCNQAEDVVEPKLKLVVDNTRQAGKSACFEENQTGLRLVVDNLPPSNTLPEAEIIILIGEASETELSSESSEVGESVISPDCLNQPDRDIRAPSENATTPDKKTTSISTTVDFRLKELMVQRDKRLKRVKRLEVVGDTLYVAFWSSFDQDDGPGGSWLADVRYFYTEVTKVEIV